MELHSLSIEEEILVSVRRIVRAIELQSQMLVATVGLTGPQISVLKAIRKLTPATPTTLAGELRISQPTVSGIVDRLVARHLVTRTDVAGDRRKHALELSEAGAKALASAPSLLQERFRSRLSQLESWERLLLLSSLQRIAILMDAEAVTATPHLTPGAAPGGADVSDGSKPAIETPRSGPS